MNRGAWVRLAALFAAWGLVALLGLPTAAQAHLMVAQHGTLNLAGDGGYLVLSLPVTAFEGVDDNGDGLLSVAELRAHAPAIEAQVLRGAQLLDGTRALPLQGLMLNLAPPDDQPLAPSPQIVVLGRYDLSGVAVQALTLRFTLYGRSADEQRLAMTVTRKPHAALLRFEPGREEQAILPTPAKVFGDALQAGLQHILTGPDHLLFLLVVLSTGWGWRTLGLALSCFTLGHGLSLAACIWGWITPSSWVEPAIAATIIGMALFDRWSARRATPWPAGGRLALVFGCSLVHGLGLAGALNGLQLDADNRLFGLAGFNLGIELGQLAVALVALGLLAALKSRAPRPTVADHRPDQKRTQEIPTWPIQDPR